GDHRPARPQRGGHRLAAGADRALDPPNQRAHRAPAGASQGPLLAARPAEAGRPSAAAPAVLAEAEPRGVPRANSGARPQEIDGEIRVPDFSLAPAHDTSTRGWKFERAPRRRGADSNLHLRERSGGLNEHYNAGP